MIKNGRINTAPSGEKVQVIIGTNRDEMALFLIALGIILDGKEVTLPVNNFDTELVVRELALDLPHVCARVFFFLLSCPPSV